ncbi:unnamed protein product [Schistosoma curassoni]|uniref:Reverse transcriptase domain-containing protein n=1 Tax=Schistosoma curassoni TaxID=6186 RepID=A0A183KXS1_9TREM|nr:unnamed protein product [Schistosoma curassoni]
MVKMDIITGENPANKQYVIVDVPIKKELMIACKEWIVGKGLCLFPKDLIETHLQNYDQPDNNWSVIKCNDIHKLGPLKCKENFLYNSLDMDVAEMQASNSHVQYPKFRLFEKVVSPIAKYVSLLFTCLRTSSTQLETSPSTSESKQVGGAIAAQLYTMMHKMSSAITDLSVNVKQLLSKSNERGKPHQFDCGLSSQQFPLSSEEELQMLETGLQQKETRDRFMAMVTRLSGDDPKASMRYVLTYLLTPDIASALTNRSLSSSVNEKDLAKLYDMATQGYFHDVRDKVIKRKRRKGQDTSKLNKFKIVLSNKFQAFHDLLNGEGTTMKSNWKGIKEAITSTCHEVLGHKKHHHKEWINVDTLDKIQERRNKKTEINTSRTRAEKAKAQAEYTETNKQVKRSIRTDKRKYVEDLATTAEKAAREGNMRQLYDTTKKLSGNRRKPERLVKSKEGKVITNIEEQRNSPIEPTQHRSSTHGPPKNVGPPTIGEISMATGQIKSGKAA